MYIDIAVGLMIGWIVSLFVGEQHLSLMLFGMFATLAPDLDFIVWLVRNKWRVNQYAHEHRDLLHLPLIFGLGGGLLIALFSPLVGVVWFFGTLAHFIHDTFDGGFGIKWLYPFSSGYFTLASYSPKRYFRNREEQRAVATVYGNPHWLEEQYLRLNPKLVGELMILAIASVFIVYWLLTR
ncbi:MAG: metal-dependent hydrolase [Candidatus Moranbacteria bacterium]|nr:metal-dependent hydrolase [Candidatus Moranbacteria bacterium]